MARPTLRSAAAALLAATAMLAASAVAQAPQTSIATLAPDIARPATASEVELAAIEPGLSRPEALARLRQEGFRTVTRLVRDSEGNWIGAARRDNRVVDIAVDGNGDVIAW